MQSLPYISEPQVEQWLALQQTIDSTRDYLIRAVPEAQYSIAEAEKILDQRTYTLVFFGGTGVGKSTLINALLGRNLLPTGAVTAVTGTIVYIEQAEKDEPESLTLSFWNATNLPQVRRLCQLSEMESFDITRRRAGQARADIGDHGRRARQHKMSATNTGILSIASTPMRCTRICSRTGRPRRRPCPGRRAIAAASA